MAYTLKSTGLAASARSVIAVDEDGTVKDFVSGTGATISTFSQTSTAGSWKGTTRKYYGIRQAGGTDPLNFDGVTYSTGPNIEQGAADSGWSLFIACHAAAAPGGTKDIFSVANSNGGWATRNGASSVPLLRSAGITQGTGSTAWPTDGTKFSAGFVLHRNSSARIWYCLESTDAVASSTALEVDGTCGDDGNTFALVGLGGLAGEGSGPMSPYIAFFYDGKLAVTDFRTLHDDWFATLFDSGATTTRGTAFGHRGTAFNGGRTFHGILQRIGLWLPRRINSPV